jgi:hypothetical protein
VLLLSLFVIVPALEVAFSDAIVDIVIFWFVVLALSDTICPGVDEIRSFPLN